MNNALLLSGGTGSRISTDIPKQYLTVGGRMLVTYALEPLLTSPLIDRVAIVADQAWREAVLEDVRKAGMGTEKITGFADPGRNRQGSILNGLQLIISQINKQSDGGCSCGSDGADGIEDADTVLVHDGARPFLSVKMLHACYEALEGYDGVMPVLPMKDTVYLSRNGRGVDGLLDRGSIYAGQAPELFLLKKYYRANTALLPHKILEVNGSTEPAVMAGMDIAMIPGEERNFKITTGADLQKARELLLEKRSLT